MEIISKKKVMADAVESLCGINEGYKVLAPLHKRMIRLQTLQRARAQQPKWEKPYYKLKKKPLYWKGNLQVNIQRAPRNNETIIMRS